MGPGLPDGQTTGSEGGQQHLIHYHPQRGSTARLCPEPVLYSLYTHDCVATSDSNTITKVADNTDVVIWHCGVRTTACHWMSAKPRTWLWTLGRRRRATTTTITYHPQPTLLVQSDSLGLPSSMLQIWIFLVAKMWTSGKLSGKSRLQNVSSNTYCFKNANGMGMQEVFLSSRLKSCCILWAMCVPQNLLCEPILDENMWLVPDVGFWQ